MSRFRFRNEARLAAGGTHRFLPFRNSPADIQRLESSEKRANNGHVSQNGQDSCNRSQARSSLSLFILFRAFYYALLIVCVSLWMYTAFIKKGNEEKNTKVVEGNVDWTDGFRESRVFFFFLWKFIDDDICINICMLHFD